jgi:hypothetical protein
MPLWLRKFTFHKINNWYEKQNADSSTNNAEESIANMKAAGAVAKKEVNVPSYVTKASKK